MFIVILIFFTLPGRNLLHHYKLLLLLPLYRRRQIYLWLYQFCRLHLRLHKKALVLRWKNSLEKMLQLPLNRPLQFLPKILLHRHQKWAQHNPPHR
jgi:hypothetical protein